ncbi:MAG: hypothetical protein ABIO91_09165 [Pyrinomonadaceae bacterium]
MIKIMILVFLAGSLSCGSGATIAGNAPPTLAPARSDIKQPSEIVAEFMALVSSGEVEKAEALMEEDSLKFTHKKVPGNGPKSGVDAGPANSAWIKLLGDGNYVFAKVLSEKVDVDTAEVKVELKRKHPETSGQDMIFHLALESNKWLISDIEFVFDKPSDIAR